MEDKPLLIFPISNELKDPIIVSNTDYVPDRGFETLFEKMVIIQPLDRNMHETKAMEKFELPKNCVKDIRCYIVRRKNYMRAVVIFHEAKDARDTVLKCNRTSNYPDVCAIVAKDLLKRISNMEEEIKSKSCFKEMNQIVLYADYRPTVKTILKHKVTELFSPIGPDFSLKLDNAQKGMASVQLPSLSQALSAEFAFCSGLTEPKTFVILNRDSLNAQHDLAVRVSLIGRPEEKLLGQQKTMCEANIKEVKLVYCNTLDCDACLKDSQERNEEFHRTKGLEAFSSCGESEEPSSSDELNTSERKHSDGNSSVCKTCPDESSADDKMCPDESSSDVESRPKASECGVKRYRYESSSDAMTFADDTSTDSMM